MPNLNVSVVRFANGVAVLYVNALAVGKVNTRADGKLFVSNETSAFWGWEFESDAIIERFTRLLLNNAESLSTLGAVYVGAVFNR